ncbi:hypothetical protein RHMOL_Rhmol08G0130100 [Rhododendron molle]|uniref:Uncharacterized protein n=1 Tax=Rhododendron molle TaxID=49168 RepID=A0ACC0MP17_RHOML|nr:hypothetical protein RHMOL_Rhmol08G0130100 [Rhododendron molle]
MWPPSPLPSLISDLVATSNSPSFPTMSHMPVLDLCRTFDPGHCRVEVAGTWFVGGDEASGVGMCFEAM